MGVLFFFLSVFSAPGGRLALLLFCWLTLNTPVWAQRLAQTQTQPEPSSSVLSEEEEQRIAIQQYLANLALAKSNLGAVYYVEDRLDSAETHLRDALKIAPGFAVAHLVLGLVHYKRKNFPEAISEFSISAEGDTIGQRRMNMVSPDTLYVWAKNQFDRLLGGPPNLPGAHTTLAVIYTQGGYLGDAEHHFREAIRIDSVYVDAYNNLGKLYADTQRFDEAAAMYEKALTMPLTDEQKPRVYLNLGVSYMGLNRTEEALQAWRAAIGAKPDYAEAYLNLGLVYQSENLPDSAQAAWTRAVTVKPDFVAARVALARLASDEGHLAEAEKHYRQILEMGVKDPRIYGELAFVYVAQEKYEQALVHFDEAVKLDAAETEWKAGRMQTERRMKARDEARRLRKIRLRQIVVRVKAEAEQILNQLRAGADFAKMAQTKSIDTSAADGGDLGYFGPGEMLPVFEEALTRLKPGEISGILETPMGYHILKRME